LDNLKKVACPLFSSVESTLLSFSKYREARASGSFFAERPPPSQVVQQQLLMAAEEREEYF
jgi:hypothetical protein